MFNCNLDEIEADDLSSYKNLSEFFRRKLKPGSRVINKTSSLVCPCDGKILNFGVIDNGVVEQVKGVDYSLQVFLGETKWNEKPLHCTEQYESSLKKNPDNVLYYSIIYLAPGDYHRFHSPSEWSVFSRRHYPGELYSVSPIVAKWLKDLYNLNERAVYYGCWKHGFFSMTAVGATNVGSIKVEFDPVII
jgi:phosphatidylserine decarboxylase